MAASVRIEDEAFSDIRYDVLALTCQLADADHARGKMAKLWRQCTQQQSHVLPVSVVVSVLGPNAAEGLETASLGEEVEGGIRIRGTRGRIEWLGKLRKNAKKGGKAKAAKRQSVGTAEEPRSLPPPFPPAPAPAPAPAPSKAISVFDLEAAYDAYPRKAGKQQGLKKAKQSIRTETDYQALLTATRRMADLWRGHDLTYCPHWSSFISQERWRDEQLPAPSSDRQARGTTPPDALPPGCENWKST